MGRLGIFVVAGALAFIAAGTYIIFGPPQRSRKKVKDPVPGLQNLGNSCFLNAVLQALAACPLFINWLRVIVRVKEIQDNEFTVSSALLSVLRALNKSSGLCSAAKVINALRTRRWVISNEEQDAHELFHVVTTTLEEELMHSCPVLSLLEVTKLERNSSDVQIDSKKPFISSSTTSTLKNNLPFRGLLANQLVCKECGYKYPVKYDTFDSISLSVPSPFWGQLTLHDCLKKFISCEQVSGVTCDICCKQEQSLNGKTKSTFIKQLSFGKLPQCLCFHIQRTVWLNNGVARKCFDHIVFPEILNMESYMYKKPCRKDNTQPQAKLIGGNMEKHDLSSHHPNNIETSYSSEALHPASAQQTKQTLLSFLEEKNITSSSHVYQLKSVIVHLGDLLSGHFVTYRHGLCNTSSQNKWFCTSDSATREAPLSEVMQACAYMLFYEKIAVSE